MPRTAKNSAWTGAGRTSTVESRPIPQASVRAATSVLPQASVKAATPAPTDPRTGKLYRPGERLERQARKFARKHQRAAPRPERDYEAMITRAIENLAFED